jgi:hypothetical protein
MRMGTRFGSWQTSGPGGAVWGTGGRFRNSPMSLPGRRVGDGSYNEATLWSWGAVYRRGSLSKWINSVSRHCMFLSRKSGHWVFPNRESQWCVFWRSENNSTLLEIGHSLRTSIWGCLPCEYRSVFWSQIVSWAQVHAVRLRSVFGHLRISFVPSQSSDLGLVNPEFFRCRASLGRSLGLSILWLDVSGSTTLPTLHIHRISFGDDQLSSLFRSELPKQMNLGLIHQCPATQRHGLRCVSWSDLAQRTRLFAQP